jgi:hypothetical protein
MTFVRSLFAFTLIASVSGFSTIGDAKDTKIKVTCTCRDNVGTWVRSCYSVSTCAECCAYIVKSRGGSSSR